MNPVKKFIKYSMLTCVLLYATPSFSFSVIAKFCTQEVYNQKRSSQQWGVPISFLSVAGSGIAVAGKKEGKDLGTKGTIGATVAVIGVMGALMTSMMPRGPCKVSNIEDEKNKNLKFVEPYADYNDYLLDTEKGYLASNRLYLFSSLVSASMIFLAEKDGAKIASGVSSLIPIAFYFWNRAERKNKKNLFTDSKSVKYDLNPIIFENSALGLAFNISF